MVAWLGRAFVTLLSVAVVAAVGFGWYTYRTAADNVVRDDVIPAAPEQAPSARDLPRTSQTILLVGLDSRTDNQGNPLPREVLDALNAGDATGVQNTDTMMVVHIPADPEKKAFAVSLPRDSYVDIAGGFGEHKLNSAYVRGKNEEASRLQGSGLDAAAIDRESSTAGRKNLIATVQNLTGLTIDHYAEINLYGFSELTKAVGGVPVCLNEPVHDTYSGANFPAGEQVLQGVDALRFVRQRHGLPNGDLDRVRRQQAFMAGLTNQLFSSGTLTSPSRISSLVDALTKSVVLDQNWDLMSFATQVATLTGDDIQFSTIPTGTINLSTPYDGSAVEVDPDQVRAYFQGLLNGPTASTQSPPTPPVEPGTPEAGYHTSTPDDRSVTVQKLAQEQPDAQTITAAGIPCVN
ncbi:LCP family protein [Actinophytocola oryzae]|uniref:LytR family transcriptional attenuator n=1 Tax=Actinophytocola oryzae TaxID=502181 RepID=A0A4R7VUW3_9PSEU|nr:LCP family protein [Actinophytocola oryzae]TDV53632.1 LytR family transcriptional attenuator [Actinophytocola oryzae]